MSRDRDDLMLLAQRLNQLGAPDAVRLLAAEADYSDDLLWETADYADNINYRHRDEEAAQLLREAAVEALRFRNFGG